MDKMSITRALTEYKTLEKRINAKMGELIPIGLTQGKNDVVIGPLIKAKDFCDKAKAEFKSLKDLMTRRDMIKCKIILSNANTKVVVGGKEYSVAEAIHRKQTFETEEALLRQLRSQLQNIRSQADMAQHTLNEKIEKMVGEATKGDSKNKAEAYDAIAKPMREAQEMHIVDPLGLDELVKNMDEEMNKFRTDVDCALSESNARNDIEV